MKGICFLFCLLPYLSASTGYPVGISTSLRPISGQDCNPCSIFASESYSSWDQEQNLAMEATLTERLRSLLSTHYQHWQFLPNPQDTPPVSILLKVEDENPIDGATLMRLILNVPRLPDPIEAGVVTLYTAGHFLNTSIMPPEVEQQNLLAALEKLFETSKIQTMEQVFKNHIPIARQSGWLDITAGTIKLPLTQERFEYLGKARFKLWLRDDRDRELISESSRVWQTETDVNDTMVTRATKVNTKDLDGITAIGFESLSEADKQAITPGPVFLITYEPLNRFAIF